MSSSGRTLKLLCERRTKCKCKKYRLSYKFLNWELSSTSPTFVHSSHPSETDGEGVFNQPQETPNTKEKCTTSGERTKQANDKSFVFVHQHGGFNVTWKPLIECFGRSKHSSSNLIESNRRRTYHELNSDYLLRLM